MKSSLMIIAFFLMPCALILGNSPGTGGGNTVFTPAKEPSWYIKGLELYVVLTEIQKQQITDIFEARAKEVTEFNEKNGEKLKNLTQGLSDATAKNDGPKIMKMGEEYQAIIKPMNELLRKYNEKLDKVLTAEQKTKLRDGQLTKAIKSAAHPVELTEQQIKAVKAAMGDSDGSNFNALGAAIDDVLTPAQKAERFKIRAVAFVKARLHAAKLTEEQLKQLDEAAAQIVKDASLEYTAVAHQLEEKGNALLTPDQKAIIEKARKPRESPAR